MEYLKAIEKGSSMAMLNLGSEEQGKKDVAKEWYLTAAEKGNSSAMYNLGILYENQGKLDLAEKWYLTAAEKGNSMARLGRKMAHSHRKWKFFGYE